MMPTSDPSPCPHPRVSPWLIAINYLLPGTGFVLAGRPSRGAVQAVLVLLTMALGFLLHGGVAWPTWSWQSKDFNLINNLTFLVQMGGGLPSLISLAASQMHWPFPGGVPKDPYYELGVYYLIVAGAINYFATVNFYDRLVKTGGRFQSQEDPTAPAVGKS